MIYLDHNATTPIRPEVLDAMLPFLQEQYGNPSSVYALGQASRRALEEARAETARLIGAASPDEIVFTSCGSESDVFAVMGAAYEAFESSGGVKNQIITTSIEHEAIISCARLLKRRGFETLFLPVDGQAAVSAGAVEEALSERTALVSVMHANNEVGPIQAVEPMARRCRERGVLFHTDAVQSVGKIPVNVEKMGVSLLSLSGHKLNAPKGVGALYVRRGARLQPLITGNYEKFRRGGTLNVASIVGLGAACRLIRTEGERHAQEWARMRERLVEGILAEVPDSHLSGDPVNCLPNTVHFCLEGIDGHNLVVALDMKGAAVSSGAACSSGAAEPSHVLKAMGISSDWVRGALRISLGWGNQPQEIEAFLKMLPPAVDKLRAANRISR